MQKSLEIWPWVFFLFHGFLSFLTTFLPLSVWFFSSVSILLFLSLSGNTFLAKSHENINTQNTKGKLQHAGTTNFHYWGHSRLISTIPFKALKSIKSFCHINVICLPLSLHPREILYTTNTHTGHESMKTFPSNNPNKKRRKNNSSC